VTVGYELDEGGLDFWNRRGKNVPPPPPPVASIPAVVSTKLYMQGVREEILPREQSGRNANLIHHHCLQPNLIKHGASYPLPQAWSERGAEVQRQYDLIINMAQSSTPPKQMDTISIVSPIPVTASSKALASGRSLAGIVGSNPAGGWKSVSRECCMLSGRGLCVGLITRPEQSYRVWCV